MRNDFIGTSIDGDARAACGCRNNGSNSNHGHQSCNSCQGRINASCGCNNRTAYNGNGCNKCDDRNKRNDCDNDCFRQNRSNNCERDNDCRQKHNNCDHDNDCRQNRNNCDNDCPTRQRPHDDDCACNGRTPAMVYAQHHDLDNMYCAEKALIRGTLFGCLDKPMCNERCTDNPCTSQCQEDKFTIWELRLYLNTHPCDQKALALLRKLTEQMDQDCGCAFYSDCNRWSWLDGPWPWEYQRCCGKEA